MIEGVLSDALSDYCALQSLKFKSTTVGHAKYSLLWCYTFNSAFSRTSAMLNAT